MGRPKRNNADAKPVKVSDKLRDILVKCQEEHDAIPNISGLKGMYEKTTGSITTTMAASKAITAYQRDYPGVVVADLLDSDDTPITDEDMGEEGWEDVGTGRLEQTAAIDNDYTVLSDDSKALIDKVHEAAIDAGGYAALTGVVSFIEAYGVERVKAAVEALTELKAKLDNR